MSREPSRWWYALLPFPVLVGGRYLLAGLMTQLLPTVGPSRSEALPALLLAVATSLVGALVVATAPLFVVGVLLDIHTLRGRSPWNPHWGYGTLGVVPVLGLFVEWFALISIPATAVYLGVRRRRVGAPFGHERPTGAGQPATRAPRSRWWYGVVAPPALELTGAGLLWAARTTGLLRQGSDPLALLVPVAVSLVAVGLVPVFAGSLYLDARAIRRASDGSTPDPRVWGLVGLGSLVGLALVRVTFMLPVALAYGYRRRVTTVPGSPS